MTMKQLTMLLLPLFIILLGGCSSKTEFYRLQPTVNTSPGTSAFHHNRILGIGDVRVADYLEKPELVTRLAPTHLKVHEEERWAGSLAGGIQLTLQKNLSSLLPGHTVLGYPWDEPVSDAYRLYVSVDRFDGDANGTVILEGHYSLADQADSRLVTGEKFRYVETGTPDTAGIVATQSILLERLSRRIAGKVRRYF